MRWEVKSGLWQLVGVWGVLLATWLPALGAFEWAVSGPRAAALGGAGAALRGDQWCSARNPALVVAQPSGVAASWSQQFGLPELAREVFTVGGRIRSQYLAIHGSNFGGDLYREGELGIALGWSVRPELSAGVELAGRWLDIRGYSSGRALAVAAGIVIQPVDPVELAAVWRNLNEPRINGYQDRIRESLTVGLAVAVQPVGTLVADFVQEEYFPTEYRLGAEIPLLPDIALRVGARAEPVRPTAGFQVEIGRWSFAYAGDLHPDLGPSHEVGLELRLPR
ncbi:MAG: hypothetical protein PHI18_01125 [bacterium]|nr:hypothetical protein [bacterium]